MRKLAVLMGLVLATAASANLVVNGDWATGDETGWTQWRAPWGSGETWTVSGANGQPPPAGFTDSTNDSGSFGWYQVISAPAPGPYTLTADWEGTTGGGGWAELMFFTVPTGSSGDDVVSRLDGGAAGDIAFKKDSWGLNNSDPWAWTWEPASLSPMPGGNAGVLTVGAGQDLVVGTKTGNTAAVWFDNIVVVPEPGTVLLGFAGLAFLIRRRR